LNVLWHRDYTDHQDDSAVWRTLKSALKKHPDVLLRVEVFLKKVQELESLDAHEKSGEIAPLGESLHEMRIPKTRKGGVARVYFAYANEPNTIVILDAEFKHERHPIKTESARRRLKAYRAQELKKCK
jgi:putative component of toxin-antitoxin plasmid stabilization module